MWAKILLSVPNSKLFLKNKDLDSSKIVKNIISQKSLSGYIDYEIRPGNNVQSNEDLDEVIRNTSESAYHPSCTNKMGDDHNSVVDQETKVHGIKNLRVIDASILPDIVSANLNATVVMIAERSADLIIDSNKT